jgi:hypothetical protein
LIEKQVWGNRTAEHMKGEYWGTYIARREIKRGKERGGGEKRRGIYLTVNCEFVTALLHYSTSQVAMYEACQNL